MNSAPRTADDASTDYRHLYNRSMVFFPPTFPDELRPVIGPRDGGEGRVCPFIFRDYKRKPETDFHDAWGRSDFLNSTMSGRFISSLSFFSFSLLSQ